MGSVDKLAVDELKISLSKSAEVVTPDSEKYPQSIKRWAASAEKPAGIVVFPSSAEDVSKAVLFSTSNHLEIAVCGGGHATSGSSSTDGGLCIDLSKMRGVSVDPETKTLTAQGGALWRDVDEAAEKFGLAAVGGTVNHTGIGGLTLGGGYGFLTPTHGLVIDNLLSVELVLADGSIVKTSKSENQDLFWAVKGAGIQFGVATSLVYQAHDQKGPVWGGLTIFPKILLDPIVKFSNIILEQSDGKSVMLVGFGAPPPAHQPVILALLFYNGTEEHAKAFFEPLLSLGPLADMTSAMPYSGINATLNDAMFSGARRTMKGSAFLAPLDTKYAASILEDWEEFIGKVPDAMMTVVLWEFVPFNKILEVPQTATAFANRGAYGNLLFAPGWMNPENDMACREWTRKMSVKARAELERRKLEGTDATTKESVGEYGNYDSLGATGKVVFGVNFPRLATLKQRYDPQNVFSKGPSWCVKSCWRVSMISNGIRDQ